ncbi:uncharacterized protein LOC143441685 [Arvicanthis niloticus]|uniref:uncharacterized protein LOC143311916 n=1 Tax=Arvicanthis niloticus TaxID=61156 RepID=UPI00402BDEB9
MSELNLSPQTQDERSHTATNRLLCSLEGALQFATMGEEGERWIRNLGQLASLIFCVHPTDYSSCDATGTNKDMERLSDGAPEQLPSSGETDVTWNSPFIP